MWSVLRHASFRWLWIGQTISALGDRLFTVALVVLLTERGEGPTELGLVLGTRTLAGVVFALLGGVIADRVRRTRLMVGADVVRALAVTTVAALPDDGSLAAIMLLTFVVGAGEAVFHPAVTSVLARVLPPERLQTGNAVTSIALQSTALAGPALAGVLIVALGVSTTIYLDAGSFVVSIATLLLVRESPPPSELRAERRRSPLREVLEGVRAIRERSWLLAVIAVSALQLTVVVAPWQVLLPSIAIEHLGGAGAYGGLLTAMGAGALLGGLAAGRVRPRQPGLLALLCGVPFGAAVVALALRAPLPLLALIAMLAGAGGQLFTVLWVTAIQRGVPDRLLARVFSLDYVGSLVLLPIGLVLTGPLAEAVGERTVLLAGGTIGIASALVLTVRSDVRAFGERPAS